MSIRPAEPGAKRRRAPRGSGEQLRDEILDATTELLLETGHAKAVSIRSVAQRVGVTPPSIYLHFADKDALLDAVCARYFEKLDEEMQRVAADQPSTVEVLRAQGLAYVRFATQTPELYRIATMGEGRQGSDVDMTLNSSAFLHLRNSVESLMAEGVYPPGDPTIAALQLLTAAHGVAALLIAKPYLPWGDVEEFADQTLSAACLGHIVLGLVDDDATPQQTVDWLLKRQRRKGSRDRRQRHRRQPVLRPAVDISVHPRNRARSGFCGGITSPACPAGCSKSGQAPAPTSRSTRTTVAEVVAVEPERRLAPQAREAARKAPIPVAVTTGTVERFLRDSRPEPFDAVVCSLVLCSIDDQESVLQQLFSLLRPGGELRYLEHVGSTGFRGRLQKIADATVWPRLMGNCHTHRDTEASIVGAGFEVDRARREPALPAWVPTPVAEYTIGRAVKPGRPSRAARAAAATASAARPRRFPAR